eukprot:GHVP01070091.1.p1 GENE.GHVP01070091.1~~GHVP01070091.1.p1  ORF type:complete len:288 (+),score=42.76 GHVP01070091.1:233-1096(+)
MDFGDGKGSNYQPIGSDLFDSFMRRRTSPGLLYFIPHAYGTLLVIAFNVLVAAYNTSFYDLERFLFPTMPCSLIAFYLAMGIKDTFFPPENPADAGSNSLDGVVINMIFNVTYILRLIWMIFNLLQIYVADAQKFGVLMDNQYFAYILGRERQAEWNIYWDEPVVPPMCIALFILFLLWTWLSIETTRCFHRLQMEGQSGFFLGTAESAHVAAERAGLVAKVNDPDNHEANLLLPEADWVRKEAEHYQEVLNEFFQLSDEAKEIYLSSLTPPQQERLLLALQVSNIQ